MWTKHGVNDVADLEKTVQIIFEAIDNVTDPIGEMGTALSGFGGMAGDAAEKADDLGDAIETIPAELELEIILADNASGGIADIQQGLDDIPEDIELDIGVEAGDYKSIFDDFSGSVDSTRQEIEDLFADQPWELKEFEAESWRKAIDEDMALKNEEFEAQKKLIDQQTELLDSKKALLEPGQSLISVDTTGLEPVFEDLMMNFLQKCQINISQNFPAVLLGIA
jgi:hypothetical protein